MEEKIRDIIGVGLIIMITFFLVYVIADDYNNSQNAGLHIYSIQYNDGTKEVIALVDTVVTYSDKKKIGYCTFGSHVIPMSCIDMITEVNSSNRNP